MENNNFGIPQISPFIDNVAMFDGKEELIKEYADKFKAGERSNLAGVNLAEYSKGMARVIKF